MNMYGWTTWGTCDMGEGIGPGRLYKHHSGLIVAIPESYEDDHFLVLAQMVRYLEAVKDAESDRAEGAAAAAAVKQRYEHPAEEITGMRSRSRGEDGSWDAYAGDDL